MALNIKIIDNAISSSLGLDFMIGAIAAIAVAPHIAVPEDINRPKELLILNALASSIPIKNIAMTNKDICKKNSEIKLIAVDEVVVKPMIIIPAWSNFVPKFGAIKFWWGLIDTKMIPKIKAKTGIFITIEMEIKIIKKRYLII